MRNRPAVVGLGAVTALLIGCGGHSAGDLPTATPPPIIPTETVTATFLPPPTVTSFPTATQRGDTGVVPPLADASQTTLQPGAPMITSTASGPTAVPTTAVSTATLTQPPPPIPIPDGTTLGDRIFTADFFQGWPPADFPGVKMGIVDGQYVITAGPSDAGVRNSGAVNQKNLVQQIELTFSTCPEQTGFGLRFRQKDSGSYYRFSVFCDNTYAAGIVLNGSVTIIGSGSLPSDVDALASGKHALGVAAFNQGFTFYFDGKLVGTASEATLDQGDVAFYAFSQGTHVISVAFDNWQVWSLR